MSTLKKLIAGKTETRIDDDFDARLQKIAAIREKPYVARRKIFA